eukprot:Opistho-2@58824
MKAILSRLAAAEVPFITRTASKTDLSDKGVDASSRATGESIAVASADPVVGASSSTRIGMHTSPVASPSLNRTQKGTAEPAHIETNSSSSTETASAVAVSAADTTRMLGAKRWHSLDSQASLESNEADHDAHHNVLEGQEASPPSPASNNIALVAPSAADGVVSPVAPGQTAAEVYEATDSAPAMFVPPAFKRRSSVIATGLLARRLSEVSLSSNHSEVRGQISSSSPSASSGDVSSGDDAATSARTRAAKGKKRTLSRNNSADSGSTGSHSRRGRSGSRGSLSGQASGNVSASAKSTDPSHADHDGMDISEALKHSSPAGSSASASAHSGGRGSPPTLTRRLSFLNVGVSLPTTTASNSVPPMIRRHSKGSIDSIVSSESFAVGPRSVLEDPGASDTAAQNKMASAAFESITAAVASQAASTPLSSLSTGNNPPSPKAMMAAIRRRSVANALGQLQQSSMLTGEAATTGESAARRFSIKSITSNKDASSGDDNARSGGEGSANGKARSAPGTDTEKSVGGRTTDEEADSLTPERWNQWGQMLADWDTYIRWRGRTVRQCVREGIPAPLRGLVWQRLSKSYLSSTREVYEGLLRRSSSSEKQIRRDIVRTFPLHSFFAEREGQGQESLFNVLKAYSLYDAEVGYCQGSPFLVGLLLMQMPEEESFCTLVRIMYDYSMRELFKPGMLALEICLYQFDNLILEFMPDLHNHFKMHGVEVTMFGSQWFLTMFAASLPLPVVNRIMDIFFSEGMHTLFRFALAFLEQEKGILLALDFDEMLVHLKNGMTKKYKRGDSPLTNELVNKAVNYRLSTRTLARLEKEFLAEKQRQAMEMDEIARLKRDLQKSQEKMQELNAENKVLADRLLQAQVIDFQNKEEIYRCVCVCVYALCVYMYVFCMA